MAEGIIPSNTPKKQPCTHSELLSFLFYDQDKGSFKRKNTPLRSKHWNSAFVGKKVGRIDNTGYLRVSILGKSYLAHRLAWFYVIGEWPSSFIDHINCNKLDNRFSNLRPCSHAENLRNCRKYKNNTSSLKGVQFVKGAKLNPWRSEIRMNKKAIFLGRFRTAEEAHLAYVAAANNLHKEFARP